jgi:hypothetical protein
MRAKTHESGSERQSARAWTLDNTYRGSGMDTKLTLKMDQSVIRSIKKYAEKNNRSLSKLVEDYFKNLVADNEPEKQYSPLVEELSGVISAEDLKNLDYVSYLEKKYE